MKGHPRRTITGDRVSVTVQGKTPPASWNDLLKPEYKGLFSIAKPALSGTAFVSVGMLVVLKRRGLKESSEIGINS